MNKEQFESLFKLLFKEAVQASYQNQACVPSHTIKSSWESLRKKLDDQRNLDNE